MGHFKVLLFGLLGYERWGGLRPASMWTFRGVRYVPVAFGYWIRWGKRDVVCRWKIYDEEQNIYFTGCDRDDPVDLADEIPGERGYWVCPFCGRKIDVNGMAKK